MPRRRPLRAEDALFLHAQMASVAEALGRLLSARGEETADRVLRIAVPRAWPAADGRNRPPGNRSAAITLDVPLGPLSPAGRLAATADQAGRHLRQREPDGGALVLRAMNLLPPPVQRRAARSEIIVVSRHKSVRPG